MWFLEQILAWALIAAVLLNLANVLMRFLLGKSILGSDEMQIFVMVWTTFLGAAIVSWRGQHLRMDALVRYLPVSMVRFLRAVELLMTVVLSGFVSYHSFIYAKGMYLIKRTSEAAEIPMVIPHSAVLAGFVIITLLAVHQLVRAVRRHTSDKHRSGASAMQADSI